MNATGRRAVGTLVGISLLGACAPGAVTQSSSAGTRANPTTPATIDLPAEFLFGWIGETRLIPGLGSPQDRSIIEFTSGEGTSFQYHVGEDSVMASRASAFSSDQIELTSVATAPGVRSATWGRITGRCQREAAR